MPHELDSFRSAGRFGRAWPVAAALLLAAFLPAWGQSPATGPALLEEAPAGVSAEASPATAPASQNPAPPADEADAKPINLWNATVLGVVEGLTEYLPVSSTGHLILASHFMGLGAEDQVLGVSRAVGAYEIVIQLGAILAVLGLYRKRVMQMLRGLAGRDRRGLHLFLALLVAFLPAAILGVLLRTHIKEHLFSPAPVVGALIVGGVVMIVVERLTWQRRHSVLKTSRVDQVTYLQALAIGLAQCLAMWPGTSRSMITIVAALVVGLNLVTAAEFSFLLALPTLGGATVLEGAKEWDHLMASAGPEGLAVGLVVSGIVAALAVKGFVQYLTHHGMWPFGLYRILFGIAVGIVLYLRGIEQTAVTTATAMLGP